MRTLSSTLTTAQKSAARAPYLRVRIIPRPAGVGRLDWSRLYTGAEPLSFGANLLALPVDALWRAGRRERG